MLDQKFIERLLVINFALVILGLFLRMGLRLVGVDLSLMVVLTLSFCVATIVSFIASNLRRGG